MEGYRSLRFHAQEQRGWICKKTKERGKNVYFVYLRGRKGKVGRCTSPADAAAVVEKHFAKQKLIDLADPGGSSASSAAVSEQPEGVVLGRRKRAARVDYEADYDDTTRRMSRPSGPGRGHRTADFAAKGPVQGRRVLSTLTLTLPRPSPSHSTLTLDPHPHPRPSPSPSTLALDPHPHRRPCSIHVRMHTYIYI